MTTENVNETAESTEEETAEEKAPPRIIQEPTEKTLAQKLGIKK